MFSRCRAAVYLLALGLLALLSAAPLPGTAQAPVFDRAQVVGAAPAGGGTSSVRTVVLDAQGNQYVAGTFNGTVSFGAFSLTSANPVSSSDVDAYVGKLDAQGTWRWVAPAAGMGRVYIGSVVVDATGNVYVGGSFTSPQLQLGARTLNNSSNQAEAFVAKLDAQGTWLWARRAGGTGSDGVSGLALRGPTLYVGGGFGSVTADFGATVLTNNYTVSDGRTDVFVADMNAATGAWGSVISAGGPGTDIVLAMTQDGRGNLYFTGQLSGSFTGTSATFGSTTLTTRTGSSVPFVAKLAPGRGWRWAAAPDNGFNTRGSGGSNAIVVDGQGQVTVSGSFNSPNLRFGPTSLSATGPADLDGNLPGDGFVAQLDSTGAWRWARQSSGSGNDFASGLSVDGFGNVTTAVTFRQTATFGPTTLASNSGQNIAVVQFSPAGTWSWVQRGVAGSGGITVLADNGAGRLYLGGTFINATADFGSWGLVGNSSPGNNTTMGTGFLARLSAPALATTTGRLAAAFSVYPNPARGEAWVSGLPPRTAVLLLDAVGRRVAAGVVPMSGPLRLALPLALPAGVYVVRAAGHSQRLLVQ